MADGPRLWSQTGPRMLSTLWLALWATTTRICVYTQRRPMLMVPKPSQQSKPTVSKPSSPAMSPSCTTSLRSMNRQP